MANGRPGAPIGNKNGAKDKLWLQAVQRHLHARPKDLEEIIEVVFEQAKAGQAWAVQEIANRLDGKPVQQVDMNASVENVTERELSDAQLLQIIAQGNKRTNGHSEPPIADSKTPNTKH